MRAGFSSFLYSLLSMSLFAPLLRFQVVQAAENFSSNYSKPDNVAYSKTTVKGSLFVIGGGADSVLKRFVDIAGGASASILIIPHSSSITRAGADLAKDFKKLGVAEVKILKPGSTDALPDCTAIYMGGGDQNRLLQLLKPEQIKQLNEKLKEGCIVGGSSAGAAAMPVKMIGGGMSDGIPKAGSLKVADGLGLLPGFMVDTHVNPRGRQDRLMLAMAMVEGVDGIGLDEDTAVEIHQGRATVFGKGVAHVYRRSKQFSSNLNGRKVGEPTSVKDVVYSVYAAGDSFDLLN